MSRACRAMLGLALGLGVPLHQWVARASRDLLPLRASRRIMSRSVACIRHVSVSLCLSVSLSVSLCGCSPVVGGFAAETSFADRRTWSSGAATTALIHWCAGDAAPRHGASRASHGRHGTEGHWPSRLAPSIHVSSPEIRTYAWRGLGSCSPPPLLVSLGV